MATYLYEADGARHGGGAAPAAGSRKALTDKLEAGDTLVIGDMGCLGESYAEISTVLHELMRRRIIVRCIGEGIALDGGAEDDGAQASRDALIAFSAAAAAAAKTAGRVARSRQEVDQALAWPPRITGDSNASVLQFGVIVAQLGALALAAFLFSLATQDSRRPLPAETSSRDTLQTMEKATEPPRYATREFLSSAQSESGEARPRDAAPSPSEPRPPASADASRKNPDPEPQNLGLSPEREREILGLVGAWRSARLKGAPFPFRIGAAVPAGVHLATFPRGLVREEPSLRGYKFVVAGQSLGVVDPAARRIVAVLSGLPAGSTASAQ